MKILLYGVVDILRKGGWKEAEKVAQLVATGSYLQIVKEAITKFGGFAKPSMVAHLSRGRDHQRILSLLSVITFCEWIVETNRNYLPTLLSIVNLTYDLATIDEWLDDEMVSTAKSYIAEIAERLVEYGIAREEAEEAAYAIAFHTSLRFSMMRVCEGPVLSDIIYAVAINPRYLRNLEDFGTVATIAVAKNEGGSNINNIPIHT